MRLIDADKVIEIINMRISDYLHDSNVRQQRIGNIYKTEVKPLIEKQPTIDAEPVVLGEWKTNSDYPDTVICSECEYRESVWWADEGTNYCPNCGATMGVTPCE